MIFANFHYFFREKKMDFQPWVCPCDVNCDSEHKQINLYLDKKFYGKSLYAILNRKQLEEFLHRSCNKNKKNVVFVTTTTIPFIAKN